MGKSIRLHKEFGLNPTMPICIICQKEKGEIALLGASYKGEAPKNMLLDIEPCDTCREQYLKNGVLLVESESEKGNPTGNITVIKDSAFKRIFDTALPKGKIAKVEIGVLQKLQA